MKLSLILKTLSNKTKKNVNSFNFQFDNFDIFSNTYGEYIVVFNKNGNISFYNKFKKLIQEDVYNYFNFSFDDPVKKELIFEFVFSSLISSYTYWYDHKNLMNLESFINFANSVIASGVATIIKSDKLH